MLCLGDKLWKCWIDLPALTFVAKFPQAGREEEQESEHAVGQEVKQSSSLMEEDPQEAEKLWDKNPMIIKTWMCFILKTFDYECIIIDIRCLEIIQDQKSIF